MTERIRKQICALVGCDVELDIELPSGERGKNTRKFKGDILCAEEYTFTVVEQFWHNSTISITVDYLCVGYVHTSCRGPFGTTIRINIEEDNCE